MTIHAPLSHVAPYLLAIDTHWEFNLSALLPHMVPVDDPRGFSLEPDEVEAFTGTSRPSYIYQVKEISGQKTYLEFSSYQDDNNPLLWRLSHKLGCYIENSYIDHHSGIKGVFETSGIDIDYCVTAPKMVCSKCGGDHHDGKLPQFQQFCDQCI